MVSRPHGRHTTDPDNQHAPDERARWLFDASDNSDLIDSGFRNMRTAAAIMVIPLLLTFDPQAAGYSLPVSNLFSAIGLSSILLGINLLSRLRPRLNSDRERLALSLMTLIADAAMTAVFALLLGHSNAEMAWFLLFIPVLEAGMRFGLLGSLLGWFFIVSIGMAVDFLTESDIGFFHDLPATFQRMGIVLLVAIPGIHLAQRLLLDIRAERLVTEEARQRSNLLETVAQSSQRVGRLDAGMVEEVLNSALLLGLDVADVCVKSSDGRWNIDASRRTEVDINLPDPNGPSNNICATPGTGEPAAVYQVGDDGRVDSLLRREGLGSMVVSTLGADGIAFVILRGGTRQGRPMTKTISDCVELLAGNATIALQNKRLVGELRAMQGRLHHQAFHDELTGLPNRTSFIDELERRLRQGREEHSHCGVAFVDLDRFKPVNDSLGHDAGNELLVAVGRRLQSAVGPADMVARFGGDEFVVLLDRVDHDDSSGEAAEVADAVCRAISSPFNVSGHEANISCSVGVAITSGATADAAEIVRRADLAMYRAKSAGKARWVRYQADLDEEVVSRIKLENDLRRAISDQELSLEYQAIVSMRNGSIIGAESLLRWVHPEFGPQNPEHLVPIAEDSGQILELGGYIMTAACERAAMWQKHAPNSYPVMAMNVSPRQLFHVDFFDMFDDLLGRSGVDPRGLILEITENLVGHGDDCEDLLAQVRSRGVRVAMDDFGQGQTSLRYLRRFPLDLLKIDKTFVQQGDTNREDKAILQSIIRLGHDLGLVVIAEGVETRSQLQLLRELDCDLVQGYLLHRPSSAADLEKRWAIGSNPPEQTEFPGHQPPASSSLTAVQAP